jgi:predicted RNase H-like HicB family nuclease
MEKSYWARFFIDDNGRYSVDVPDLPGCLTFGDSWEESLYMARDAVRGWLETTLEDGDPLPKASGHKEVASLVVESEMGEPLLELISVTPFGSELHPLLGGLLVDLARVSAEQGVPINELLAKATREFLARQTEKK